MYFPQSCVTNPAAISLSDTAYTPPLAGKAGEFVAAGLHGKYFTQCARGNVFIGSSAAAGVSIRGSGGSTLTTGLWNPAGNLLNLVPIKIQISIVTVSGPLTDNLQIGTIATPGAQIGTAAAFTAFTVTTPVNARLDSTVPATGRFTNSATGPAGLVLLRSLGISSITPTTPIAANSYWQLTEHYDGELILGPGRTLFVCANITLWTGDITIVWEEVPI